VRVQEVGAAAVRTTVFLAGGLLADGSASDQVLAYDTNAGAWSEAPRLPVALHHAAAVAWRGSLMVLGGFTQDGRASDRVLMLDHQRWRDGPALHHARGAAAAAVSGARVVIAGGIAGSSHVTSPEIYDGRGWRDGAPIPTPRDHVSGASDGRLFYAALGRAAGRHLAAFESYDPAANAWRVLPDVPVIRSGGGAVFITSRILVGGGEGSSVPGEAGVFDDVDSFDVITRTWSRMPRLKQARHGLGLVRVNSALYALAGGDRAGLAATAACERLVVPGD
jgi:N-acetylneuraminic acid mutarotase